MTRLTCLTAITLLTAACSSGGTNGGGNTNESIAVITTRDSMNMSGAINTVSLTDKKVVKAIDTTLDADNRIHIVGDKAYVLNRQHATLRIYDAKTWKVETEVSVGMAMSFVQDAIPLPGTTKVYLTYAGNLGKQAVGVLDTANTQAGIGTYIEIPAIPKDTDGKPEPGPLYECKGLLYTPLGDYDSVTTFAPLGPGRIAIIDPTQNKLAGIVQLKFENPAGLTAVGSDCTQVIVGGSGPFGTNPDATSGIERVDLTAKTSVALTDGTKLKGTPGTIVIDGNKAYMILYYDLQTVMGPMGGYQILARSKIVGIDITSGALTGDLSAPAGYIGFLKLDSDGQLWFGNDNLANVDTTGNLADGVYVGKPSSGMIAGPAIDLGQVPYDIDFQ